MVLKTGGKIALILITVITGFFLIKLYISKKKSNEVKIEEKLTDSVPIKPIPLVRKENRVPSEVIPKKTTTKKESKQETPKATKPYYKTPDKKKDRENLEIKF